MDEIISEDANMSLMQVLAESSNSMFEPYYEDATNYLIEASNNLRVISDTMGINLKEKIYGQTIMVNENASKIYIKDQHDTIVVNAEEYLSDEISRYMGSFSGKKLTENRQIFDMSKNNILSESGLTDAFYNAVREKDLRSIRIMMKDSLLIDPSFKQFEEMQKAASGLKGLFVPHDGRELEGQGGWDKDYMNAEMVRIVNNFSHERVNHLKKVVRFLYPAKEIANNVAEKGKDVKPEVKQRFIKRVGQHISRNKGKYAVGALAAAGIGAAGYAAYKALKKRNAKKKEEERAKNLEECMIDIFLDEDGMFCILDEDVDFLLEVCDYDLNEAQIIENIENILIDEGFFNFGKKREQKKLERQKREQARKQAWENQIKESNRLRSLFSNKLPAELKKISRGKMFAVDIFVFEIPYDYIESGEDTKIHKMIDELKAEIQKASKYKIDEGGENNNCILFVDELLNESATLEEGFFGFGFGKKKKPIINNIDKSKIEQDTKDLKREAERLFPIVNSNLTPALKKCKDADGDDEFESWCGYDYSTGRSAAVSVCIFGCQSMGEEYGYGDNYRRFVDTVERDADRLVEKLKKSTKCLVYLDEDDDNYFIMIEKDESISESSEELSEGILQNIGHKMANSHAGQAGITIGKAIDSKKLDIETEAKRLYKLAVSKFTPAIKFAKKHDELFEDSILDKRGNTIILFTLGCQSIDGTKGREFKINSSKDYNDLINNHIIPELKSLVQFLQTKTKYKVFINYNEDSFSIGIK